MQELTELRGLIFDVQQRFSGVEMHRVSSRVLCFDEGSLFLVVTRLCRGFDTKDSPVIMCSFPSIL